MTGDIILGAILGLPLLLGMLFRVNTSYFFFSLLAGEILARYFGDDAELALRTVTHNQHVLDYAELAVLLLPIILTVLFLRHSLSKGMALFHIVPYAIMGIVFAAFALPMMPGNVQAQVEATHIGGRLLEGSDAIVGGVVFLQLVTLWLTAKSEKGKGHHRKDKKKH